MPTQTWQNFMINLHLYPQQGSGAGWHFVASISDRRRRSETAATAKCTTRGISAVVHFEFGVAAGGPADSGKPERK